MRRTAAIVILILAPLFAIAQGDSPSDRAAFVALDKSIETAEPSQRIAYNALLVAFVTFRDAHVRHETCVSATNCSQLQAEERHRLNRDFLLMANGFAPGKPPNFNVDDLTSADAGLNFAFDAATAILPPSCPGAACLSKSTFQEVERDWIRYRDAWLPFGGKRFPAISPDTWRTYLTQERQRETHDRFPIIKAA